MPRRASIRALLLRLVLAVALPLIALEIWHLYSAAKADSLQAHNQVFHLAQVTASETAKFLGQAQNIVNGFAARPAVRVLGSGLALDNFDLDRNTLALVHDVMPVYIKLAPVFTRQIGARADMRFIVEAMVRMLSPLEIPLIAQGVEDAGMIPVLAAIGFSGYQGFVAGKPEPLPVA